VGRATGASWGWPIHGLNENVHLLTDKDGKVIPVEAVDDLEHTGVNALGGVARERLLRHDVRLEADEF
jgi:uncharacterized protein YuzE